MIQSSKITDSSVSHGFFGRNHGKSSGLYASLNCSKFVGDNPEAVAENLQIVKDKLQTHDLITMKQSHGNLCVVVDGETPSDIEADGLVTKTSGVAIGVLTADCAPILLRDKVHRIVGAIHAGWRGAVSGIIESTLRKIIQLGGDPHHVVAALGPCISKESYEVDDGFKKNFPGKDDCFHLINSKLHFDLPRYCVNRLMEAGLDKDNIEVMGIDTVADSKNYFSFRFANKNTNGICGRQISAIGLK